MNLRDVNVFVLSAESFRLIVQEWLERGFMVAGESGAVVSGVRQLSDGRFEIAVTAKAGRPPNVGEDVDSRIAGLQRCFPGLNVYEAKKLLAQMDAAGPGEVVEVKPSKGKS